MIEGTVTQARWHELQEHGIVHGPVHVQGWVCKC